MEHKLLELLDDLRRQAEKDLSLTKQWRDNHESGVGHVILEDEVRRREQAVTVWETLRHEAGKLVNELEDAALRVSVAKLVAELEAADAPAKEATG